MDARVINYQTRLELIGFDQQSRMTHFRLAFHLLTFHKFQFSLLFLRFLLSPLSSSFPLDHYYFSSCFLLVHFIPFSLWPTFLPASFWSTFPSVSLWPTFPSFGLRKHESIDEWSYGARGHGCIEEGSNGVRDNLCTV